MKNLKKLAALGLAATLALATLAGCGSSASSTPKNALEAIKADGKLVVATSPDFAPMEFVDSSKTGQDQYVGFDVTLAKFIAAELGVECEISPMSFDACQTAVYTATVPMSISGYSWTETRAENYELSDFYDTGNESNQVLLIRKADADKYTKAEDFNGKDVGAQNASLQMQLLTEQLPNANAVTIGDISVGVMELQSGNIEALAVAIGNGQAIMLNNPDLVICDWEFTVDTAYEANVIMITKGETELLEAVNAALAKAQEHYTEWYEEAKALSESESAIEVSIEDPTESAAAG